MLCLYVLSAFDSKSHSCMYVCMYVCRPQEGPLFVPNRYQDKSKLLDLYRDINKQVTHILAVHTYIHTYAILSHYFDPEI